MIVPNVSKNSDMIYSYDSMRIAYQAGEARILWEEGIFDRALSRTSPEPPEFEDFMRQTFNDPRSIDFVILYRCSGDAEDTKIEITAANEEMAAQCGRDILADMPFVSFVIMKKTY